MNKPPPFYSLQPLILASGSPRRLEMLRGLGMDIDAVPVEVDETPFAGEKPDDFAARMAAAKASAAAQQNPSSWVLGADTVVSIAGNILGKPKDAADALSILKQLVNTSHRVMTGTSIHCLARHVQATWVDTTTVTFIDAADDILTAYIGTGDPMDKAGAYGIQGIGSFLIREIRGSCSNVIGLPLDSVVLFLLRHGIIAPRT
jgi:septum formation protein